MEHCINNNHILHFFLSLSKIVKKKSYPQVTGKLFNYLLVNY